MTQEPRLPIAQRLALLFRAAGTRWALPASAILEVAPAPAGGAAVARDQLPIESLAQLLAADEAASARAVTLVLDCAPPRALRVDEAEQFADLAAAPFFHVPAAVECGVREALRGVVLHAGALALEVVPERLAELQAPLAKPAAREPRPPAGEAPLPPERALVFEGGEGALFGSSLAIVTGVARCAGILRLPLCDRGLLGLMHHERSILPVYDVAWLASVPSAPPALVVCLDIAGASIGIAARSVAGVVSGLQGPAEPVPGGWHWRLSGGQRVFFPDWTSVLPV